jgi:hypothetical protein
LVVPNGFSRGFANSSAVYTTSTVRFWNFTASTSATLATSIKRRAIPRSPL